MVYINNQSGTISIPKHAEEFSDNYTMVLSSNISDDVTIVRNGINISTNNLYYKFALDNLSYLNVGEYTYTLYGDSVILEQGLLMYGNFDKSIVANDTFNKQKIQYNG